MRNDLSRPHSLSPPTRELASLDKSWAWLVAGLSGVALILTALPGPHWHDTAEFGAVARRLSLSHPPGHPIHAHVTHGLGLLPFGGAGFRANLASALPMAAAMGWLFLLLRRLTPGAPRWATALVALAPICLPGIWLQGVRSEVYALQLLLSVGVAERVAAWHLGGQDARIVPQLALLLGLAGANHTLLALCMVPVALTAVLPALRRRPSMFLPSAGVGLLALGLYAHLPLRARAGGMVGWGAPDTLQRFWDTLSGKAWRTSSLTEIASPEISEQTAHIFSWWLDQVGLVAGGVLLLTLAAGVPALVRHRRHRWLAAGASLVMVPMLVTKYSYAFDRLNPDIGGYFAAAVIAGLIIVWLVGDTLAGATGGVSRLVVPLLTLWWAPQVDVGHRMGSRSAEETARARLDEVPPEGVIAFSDYSAWFLDGWLRSVEGRRPDAAPLFRGQVRTPWYRERLEARFPELAPLAASFPEGLSGRPVLVEPGVHMEQLGRPTSAWGISRRLGSAPAPAEVEASAFDDVPAPTDLDGRRSMAVFHAHHALAEAPWIARGAPGALERARWHLARAEALIPGDPWLKEVREAAEAGNVLDEDRRR